MDNPLERRSSTERRSANQNQQFPVITRQGVCVRNDRRRHPDRRISIVVGESYIGEDAFEILFSRFSEPSKTTA